ncbi:hypothetical protein F5J12DRAFT_726956 [Pisolithus orientalis]|uniref:uncharacterized protein n=1 Tax=Pisolithus orientalis TaxID=936130 RepID=UPI0022243981|nr:uncharacterized protein F5J12DRAFT_726956 [Pisolithus orientalis]KAI5992350.1 hypothetical protein F5J12DRAFT_726956 [Pisolithus orientalis]
MVDGQPSPTDGPSRGRGRGRGKSRGGLGKYLRARGRGRGYGRPAEFSKRLVLEGEEEVELDPEEAEEQRRRYGKRQLASNADRYVEPEPELGSDGEEIREPEVDLSAFLERQKISEDTATSSTTLPDDDDVDHDFDHIRLGTQTRTRSKKGNVHTIAWDDQLEKLQREKDAADAARDLKERFREKSGKLREKPVSFEPRKHGMSATTDILWNNTIVALPLPTERAPKTPKEEMQDFLDELLG